MVKVKVTEMDKTEDQEIVANKKQVVYASLFQRLVASLIDCFLISWVINFVYYFFTKTVFGAKSAANKIDDLKEYWLKNGINPSELTSEQLLQIPLYKQTIEELVGMNLLNLTLFLIVFGFILINTASSPGKFVMGLKIVDEDTLQKPSKKQLFTRLYWYIFSTIPLCLGFIWIRFDKRRQGWHDKKSNTLVIKK